MGAVPGEGTVLEPLSRIIGMKYAGTVLSLHIFKGVLHFATRPVQTSISRSLRAITEEMQDVSDEVKGVTSLFPANIAKNKIFPDSTIYLHLPYMLY